jgi:hypothetical protein
MNSDIKALTDHLKPWKVGIVCESGFNLEIKMQLIYVNIALIHL